MGFKAAVEKARPVILEPIMHMEITVPDDSMGDVIGDLNSRRGKVEGMETLGHTQALKARVPMSEVLKYSQDLNSMTSGRGGFTMEFSITRSCRSPLSTGGWKRPGPRLERRTTRLPKDRRPGRRRNQSA